MTHLSDFSYIERATLDVYISVYLVYSVWKNDKFRCLRPSKIFSGELRSIITVIMFIMMTTQAVVDYYSTYIKYNEGFVLLPTGKIIQKPYAFWAPENQAPVQPMDYLQCVTFAFHTSVFFLMQCFWNYLSNSVAKRSFMGSFEFKFYIAWALASVAMFPVLQWRWRNDELMSEIVPQLAYGGEVLITACLGIRSNFRFKRIIAYSMRTKSSTSIAIVNRLSYFKEMNVILTCLLFIYGACFVILCADGLTDGKTINTNKFACDLLIANVNMCVITIWLLFISIFHPRRNYGSPQNSAISRSGQESEFQSKNDVEMTQNSRPMSQRITNFIQNNNASNAYGSEKYQQQPSPMSPSQPQDGYGNNGVFMRPMSPVNVDYPPSMATEVAPLTSAAAGSSSTYQRNVSVEDPYSSQSVVFSMVDPPPGPAPPPPPAPTGQQHHQRFPTPNTDMSYHTTAAAGPGDYPMHTLGVHDHHHDAQSEYDVSDYHDDTTATQAGNNGMLHHGDQEQHQRAVTDWLYRSPERKQ